MSKICLYLAPIAILTWHFYTVSLTIFENLRFEDLVRINFDHFLVLDRDLNFDFVICIGGDKNGKAEAKEEEKEEEKKEEDENVESKEKPPAKPLETLNWEKQGWKRDYSALSDDDKMNMKVDEIFALYLFTVSQKVSDQFYRTVLAFVIFFRECLNEIGWKKRRETDSEI